jgi:indole-3-glycerol phosphate synthase
MHYVKTDSYLDKILAQKVAEIAQDKAKMPANVVIRKAEITRTTDADRRPRDFAGALRRDTIALIAEVKKASPSRGVLVENFDPVALGTTYAASGAAAISVLTDTSFFQGHIGDMGSVRQAVSLPVLRKDFIIDPYQVYFSRAFCADAILLIVAALDDAQLADLHALALEQGMAALVEVHTEAEMERALRLGATLIGINNRDLKTFHVSLEVTARLARLAPPTVTLVAESGILSAADVRQMGAHGARAVLVGEALVTAGALAQSVRDFSGQPVPG